MYKVIEGNTIVEGREYTVYGIYYNDEYSIAAVSDDTVAVERLVQECNACGLDPVHLRDVAADFLVGIYG